MKDTLRIYWKLFISTLTISAFTFGGGFVIISMLRKKFVEQFHWIEDEEMLDLTVIAQSAPGALAVNAAFVVGYRIKKLKGAVVSVIGTSIPPIVIISLISMFYNQFSDNRIVAIALQVMRAGVAAVIIDVVISLAKNVIKTHNLLYITLLAATFIAACFFNVSAVVIIAACIVIGMVSVILSNKKGEKSR